MPYTSNFLRIMEWLTVSKTFDLSTKYLKYTDYFQKIHEFGLLIVE